MAINSRILGFALLAIGIIVLLLSLTIDIIGLGELSGFGPAQIVGTLTGFLIIGTGGCLYRINKTFGLDVINLLLLFTSILFALFLGEIITRYDLKAWPFEQKIKTISYMTGKDQDLRWRYPVGDGKNSLGLRNKEINTKEPDKCRILFLGDSLVFLADTSSGELYTQLIERNLNEEVIAPHKQFGVINAGIPGYTTYQEWKFLKIYGLDMQPDLVILGFVFNDLYKYTYRPTEEDFFGEEPTARLNRFDTRSFPGNIFAKSYLVFCLN